MAIALVTGASGTRSGIGFATAITLARAGHTVIATMRNPEAAGELPGIVATEQLPVTIMALDVDDDVSVRESLELLIGYEGWQPEIFASADEFLSRPRPLVPSCLILDLSLPGLSGLDLQERIASERTDMPIIFITGHGDVPMTVRAMKAGAVDFLTKPFSDETLLAAVRDAVGVDQK